jgi:thimet oligopeptidase
MWSLVIAKDLFRAFQDAGPILNPRLAAKYRQEILNPGSERPAAEMVRRYLGRDFGFDAYREWLEQTAG